MDIRTRPQEDALREIINKLTAGETIPPTIGTVITRLDAPEKMHHNVFLVGGQWYTKYRREWGRIYGPFDIGHIDMMAELLSLGAHLKTIIIAKIPKSEAIPNGLTILHIVTPRHLVEVLKI